MEKEKVVRVKSARVADGYHEGTMDILVNPSPGIPGIRIKGLSAASAKAASARILAAIRSSNILLPHAGYSVTLRPQHIGAREATSFYDLPIALGILASGGAARLAGLGSSTITGRLNEDGTLVGDHHGCPYGTSLTEVMATFRKKDPARRPRVEAAGEMSLFGGDM